MATVSKSTRTKQANQLSIREGSHKAHGMIAMSEQQLNVTGARIHAMNEIIESRELNCEPFQLARLFILENVYSVDLNHGFAILKKLYRNNL